MAQLLATGDCPQCNLSDVDLNVWMVATGWAAAYRTYSSDYVSIEGQARATDVGI